MVSAAPEAAAAAAATVAAVSFTFTTRFVRQLWLISSLHSVCNAHGHSEVSAKTLISKCFRPCPGYGGVGYGGAAGGGYGGGYGASSAWD
jgi:hypothetical protein